MSGHHVGADGVGSWSLPDNVACDQPGYAPIAAYLNAVHGTLTEGPADAMGPDVPGLIWDYPEARKRQALRHSQVAFGMPLTRLPCPLRLLCSAGQRVGRRSSPRLAA